MYGGRYVHDCEVTFQYHLADSKRLSKLRWNWEAAKIEEGNTAATNQCKSAFIVGGDHRVVSGRRGCRNLDTIQEVPRVAGNQIDSIGERLVQNASIGTQFGPQSGGRK